MTMVINEVRFEETTQTDEPIVAHIVDRGDDPRPAQALVMESLINGTPLTALCGVTWVPSRNPDSYPICEKCLEMLPFARDYRGV